MNGTQYDPEVKINIKNLYLAEVTRSKGELVFSTPELVLGLMELSREPKISGGDIYGDGKIRRQVKKRVGTQFTLRHNGLPSRWRQYIEGLKLSADGVESDPDDVNPGEFAMGYTIEKTNGEKELVWVLDCVAEPAKATFSQSEDKITWSTDSYDLLAMYVPGLERSYTSVDLALEQNKTVTEEQFFAKVQISDKVVAV